jgi:hypothetical protein
MGVGQPQQLSDLMSSNVRGITMQVHSEAPAAHKQCSHQARSPANRAPCADMCSGCTHRLDFLHLGAIASIAANAQRMRHVMAAIGRHACTFLMQTMHTDPWCMQLATLISSSRATPWKRLCTLRRLCRTKWQVQRAMLQQQRLTLFW